MMKYLPPRVRIRPHRDSSGLVCLLLLAGMGACGQEQGARSPEEAVRALHRAAAADHCQAFKTHLVTALRAQVESAHECEVSMAQLRGRDMATIVDVVTDGRDSRYALVHVRVDQELPPIVYRVTREGGSFRVASL